MVVKNKHKKQFWHRIITTKPSIIHTQKNHNFQIDHSEPQQITSWNRKLRKNKYD